MGIEGGGFNRREFLKAAVATTAATVLPEAEAAKKKEKITKPSLRGSPESLEKQNRMADMENLSRIQDDAQLAKFIEQGLLVPIPEGVTIRIDPRLSEKYRYVRPWVSQFLIDVGKDFFERFKKSLWINSAVRPTDYQEKLRERNKNAAPTNGSKQSSHMTGATIDIAKIPMLKDKSAAREQLVWMRKRLLDLEGRDLIEATEEHVQAVFHVMISKKYRK